MTDKDMNELRRLFDIHELQCIDAFKYYEVGWLGEDIWNIIKWKPIDKREFSIDDMFDYYEGVRDLLDILKPNKKRDNNNGRKQGK